MRKKYCPCTIYRTLTPILKAGHVTVANLSPVPSLHRAEHHSPHAEGEREAGILDRQVSKRHCCKRWRTGWSKSIKSRELGNNAEICQGGKTSASQCSAMQNRIGLFPTPIWIRNQDHRKKSVILRHRLWLQHLSWEDNVIFYLPPVISRRDDDVSPIAIFKYQQVMRELLTAFVRGRGTVPSHQYASPYSAAWVWTNLLLLGRSG